MTDTPPEKATLPPAFELVDDFPGSGLNNLVPYTDILAALQAHPEKSVAIRGRTEKDATKIASTFKTRFPQLTVATKMSESGVSGQRDVWVRFAENEGPKVDGADALPPKTAK